MNMQWQIGMGIAFFGLFSWTHHRYCCLQEQGRKFNTLQDELRSEGLAAAKAHFANIFRKEVVVRKLLDAGGTAGFMCSAFQMLFKAEGLAASSSDRIQKLRLLEETVKSKQSRKLECKRAEQAKRKLLESVQLKKQAVREATAVLGLHHAPSPPSVGSPVTRTANAFRGRRLRRRRRQHPPPATGLPRWGRGNRGVVGRIVMEPTDLESKGVRAFAVTSRRKDAILKRTPLCGRSAMARLPSWASCENSACDPGTTPPPPLRQDTASIASSAGESVNSDRRGVMHELPMRSGVGGTDTVVVGDNTRGGGISSPPKAREIDAAPLSATSLEEKEWRRAMSLGEEDWWEEHHPLFSQQLSCGLSAATTMTHSVKTIATTIPTAMTREVSHDPLVKSRDIGSRVSSSGSISLEPARKTVHLDSGDAQEFHPAEEPVAGDVGRGLLLPKRPENPTVADIGLALVEYHGPTPAHLQSRGRPAKR
ncbi:hypothetical protein Esi_0180_0035 [Ectocarpus siliculosus]|uniref:Uncharacterized protein n=1 Tax=Ectocarpus siliculosus TaxID=2880 RepID=D7FNU6_ECTSI|nr:hypothetical protein Esi_0180_0035 [Ectocarpus siliculosus]|eukprot:CBJ30222.1 hypothetical protein Esi_0180_0035 [Ectocarpus siliculosus]